MPVNPNSCDVFVPSEGEVWHGMKCQTCSVNHRFHKEAPKPEGVDKSFGECVKFEKGDDGAALWALSRCQHCNKQYKHHPGTERKIAGASEENIYPVTANCCPGFLAGEGTVWGGMKCVDCGTKRTEHQGKERVVVNLVAAWKLDPGAPGFQIGNVDAPLLHSLKYYQITAGAGLGSAGVFIVQTDSGVFVVKSAERCAREVFATKFATHFGRLLGCAEKEESGVGWWSAPHVTVVHQSSQDYTTLTKKLLELQGPRTIATAPGADLLRISRLAQSRNIIMFEFMRGESLSDLPNHMDHHQLRNYFDAEIYKGIGGMLLMDMLINNWDRLPVEGLWNNQGNAGNIMIHKKTKNRSMSLIDQTVTPVGADQREEYLNNITTAVSLLMKPETENKCLSCN